MEQKKVLMKTSEKPVKSLEDLFGHKTFFFPDDMANERVLNTLEKCIFLRINGENHWIMTGRRVEITEQEFAVLKDAGMVTSNYTHATRPDFDPIKRPYEV
jgi:hypothetical protein